MPFQIGNSLGSLTKGTSRNAGRTNPQWKGDQVGKIALHEWIRNRKPKPRTCQRCGQRIDFLDLANISGEYRRDISDFEWVCRACHMQSDGRMDVWIANNKTRQRAKKGSHVCQ